MAIKMCESFASHYYYYYYYLADASESPTVFLYTVLESGETLNMTALLKVSSYQSHKHLLYSQWVPMGT